MEKSVLLLVLFMVGITSLSEAQLREEMTRPGDYTGTIIKTRSAPAPSGENWMDRLNMTMGHSYSMSFGSYGGRFQNLNAYTNHMAFDLSSNLTGFLDVSVLHSPFGNSFLNTGSNSMGANIVIDRAQLDYQLSPNASLSIQFSQRPYYGQGYYPGAFSRGRNYWY